MDQLPVEINYLIAKQVDEFENRSKKTLQALSLVNSHWNPIIAPLLYEHLVVRLREGIGAIETCEWLAVQYAQNVLEHVKRLSIVAETRVRPTSEPSNDERRARRYRYVRQLFKCLPPSRDHGEALGDMFIPPVGDYGFFGGDWTPILNMIRQMPDLRNVNLFVQKGGPVELCEALSQYHPTCQVSIFTTWPLNGEFNPLLHIQQAWLSSPMLYAVHVTCFQRRTGFIEPPDRVLQSILLLAPHLKEIALCIANYNSRNPSLEAHVSRFNERVEVIGTISEQPLAKLKTLSWPLNTEMTVDQLQKWQKITDFTLLESWTVGRIKNSALFQTITDTQPFQRLTRLTLALCSHLENHADSIFWEAAHSMFQSLPSLTYIELFGQFPLNFLVRSVLPRHGSTLLELRLYETSSQKTQGGTEHMGFSAKSQVGPIFSAHDILQLAGQSSNLQRLCICVQRDWRHDTDLWTALGQFPRLEELHLLLNIFPEMDADKMPIPLRELSDFEKSPVTVGPTEFDAGCLKWFLEDYKINRAIGEDLVKEIFTHIHACQHEKSLVKLVIHPKIIQSPRLFLFQAGTLPGLLSDFFKDQPVFNWKVERDFMSVLHVESEMLPSHM
ncbi:hypothetical protein N7528_007800 [Penicillium herquei]|nr:hypothetical protein N7528_007800 [Penicillium herquei]